jgi:hypothetical protein
MLHTRYGGAIVRTISRSRGAVLTSDFNIRLSSTAIPRGKKESANISIASRESHIPPQSPLSGMPLGMLMRSLFVATISSNKFLLVPSLRILSFLSKPDRSFLLNIDRNPVLKTIIKKSFYDQFCAGTSETETKACVKQLKDLGFRGVILTYASEMVFDHRFQNSYSSGSDTEVTHPPGMDANFDTVIESWRAGTVNTIDLISGGDILAIKYVQLA